MNNWQRGFLKDMNLMGIVVILGLFGDIFRALILSELEKRVGRKLTDWDWRAYGREVKKKAKFETQREMARARQARMNDLKIIHDFVWNN